ncbi:MAG: ATP-binding protein [Vicinamibacterales bacterium]
MVLPRLTFRSKLFLAALSAATLALLVAGALFATSMRREADARIEQGLVAEVRLASELLGRGASSVAASDARELDAEADRMGALLGARVTLVAEDGHVVGDSAETTEGLVALENHGTRPEIMAARTGGLGTSRRYSDTVKVDMLYVAVPTKHPAIAFVRVALPLTDVRQQLGTILRAVLVSLGVALLGAIAIAYVASGRISLRVRLIAGIANRYRQGDLTPPRLDYGDDELGVVARALDDTVQELGSRLDDLARDRSRMASILAGMIEGVIVVDSQGRLELVNDAAQHMLKLGDASLGRHYIETIRHPATADLLTAALAGQSPDATELAPPRDPSRTIIARAASATPGQPHGVVMVLHDITELKRADQMRRDFVANVSHELRTPLTAIRGYVEALSEGDLDAEESKRFLEIITRHTLRMERLVRDLLRLARLDAGQETLEISACDLRNLIHTVVADLVSTLDSRDQHLEVSVSPGAETVQADPAKLHDVLRNLVVNASTYAPESTRIAIVASRQNDVVTIDVMDEGPGIPEEDLPRVFERFYRVDKSRARDPGGTGLGLAIVKHLVGLHGGSVSVANREPTGARFTITLRA